MTRQAPPKVQAAIVAAQAAIDAFEAKGEAATTDDASAMLLTIQVALEGAIDELAPAVRVHHRPAEPEPLWPGVTAPVCVRCGRKLLHPEWLNGAPFGRVCFRKEALGR